MLDVSCHIWFSNIFREEKLKGKHPEINAIRTKVMKLKTRVEF